MRKAALLLVFALSGTPVLAGQGRGDASPTPPAGSFIRQVAPAPAGSSQVVANTELHAVLETPLSNRISQPGDRFIATITDPVRATNGMIAIPAGSRLEGEVVEGEEVRALQGKAMLSIRFRNVVLPGGQTLPLSAVLVSVHNTTGTSAKREEPEELTAGEGPSTFVIFGRPLKGLAVGQLGGGGYVLAKKGKHVELPARTGVVIRLVQPLSMNPEGSPEQPGQE